MRTAALLALLSLLGLLLSTIPAVPAASAASVATTPVSQPLKGNLSGPSLVATQSNGTFYLNLSGGPAVLSGVFVGDINWTANLTGPNITGSSVTPSNGTIDNSTTLPVALTVASGAISETLTLTVKAVSNIQKTNSTINLTKTFSLVVPYTVRAILVAGPDATVLPFNISVLLDGSPVSTVAVPKLTPNETWGLIYRYPSLSLSSGYHTFTLSVTNEHGLVTFSNGKTVESTTFYVAPATPNDNVWYVLGVVVFFGVLFIYATRGAARRRGSQRR
jgi:hypothetical protein